MLSVVHIHSQEGTHAHTARQDASGRVLRVGDVGQCSQPPHCGPPRAARECCYYRHRRPLRRTVLRDLDRRTNGPVPNMRQPICRRAQTGHEVLPARCLADISQDATQAPSACLETITWGSPHRLLPRLAHIVDLRGHRNLTREASHRGSPREAGAHHERSMVLLHPDPR